MKLNGVVAASVIAVSAIGIYLAFSHAEADNAKTQGKVSGEENGLASYAPDGVGVNKKGARHVTYLDYNQAGIDKRYTASPELTYEHVSKCEARKSFESFFLSNQSDPDSIFNSKKKLQGLSDLKRSYLEKDLKMMTDAKNECAEWEELVDPQLAGQQLYGSALNASLAGDDNATACMMFEPWQLPDANSPDYKQLAAAFESSASSLIDRGIANGNWKVVAASVLAFRERTGLRALVPGNDATAYYYARLGQMGSYNDELASSFGYDASNFARLIAPAALEAAEAKAIHDYGAYFGSKKLTEEDITVRCGK